MKQKELLRLPHGTYAVIDNYGNRGKIKKDFNYNSTTESHYYLFMDNGGSCSFFEQEGSYFDDRHFPRVTVLRICIACGPIHAHTTDFSGLWDLRFAPKSSITEWFKSHP